MRLLLCFVGQERKRHWRLYHRLHKCFTIGACLDQNARGGKVKELEERILRDGQDLGGGILKVDGFVNHQVDAELMDECGKEFARRFATIGATKVLTAEISGIAPALTTA